MRRLETLRAGEPVFWKNVQNFLEDLWYYGCLSESQALKLYELHKKQLNRLIRDEKIRKHLVNGITYYTLSSFEAVILVMEEYQVNYWPNG